MLQIFVSKFKLYKFDKINECNRGAKTKLAAQHICIAPGSYLCLHCYLCYQFEFSNQMKDIALKYMPTKNKLH